MRQALRLAGLRLVEYGKRHFKTVSWLRSLPLMRYTYLFDVSTGIVVPDLGMYFVPTRARDSTMCPIQLSSRAFVPDCS